MSQPADGATASASPRAARLLAAGLLGVLAVLLYAPSLAHPLAIDDVPIVQNHPQLIDQAGLLGLWTTDYWGGTALDTNLYRPLTILSLHLQVRWGGVAPWPLRLANVLMLWLLALLAWRLWSGERATTPLGVCAAALVIAHPAAQASAWHVVGRSDLLALIGALLLALAMRDAAARGGWRAGGLLMAALAILTAIGAKESGAIVAIVWLVETVRDRGREGWRRRAAISAALMTALVGLYLAGRLSAVSSQAYDQGMIGALNPLTDRGLGERVAPALGIAARYLRQAVWPLRSFNLSPDPEAMPGWGSLETYLGLACLLGLLAAAARGAWRREAWALWPALALGQWLIVGNLAKPIGTYAANRLALPFVLLAGAALAAGQQLPTGPRRALLAVACLLTLAHGWRTVDLGAQWQSVVPAMRLDASEHAGARLQQLVLARALYKSALEQLREAQRRPELARPLRELARAELDEAVAILSRYPTRAKAVLLLANVQHYRGERELAQRLLERIVDGQFTDAGPPERLSALVSLSKFLIDARRFDDAERALREAASIRANHPQLRVNRALVHAAAGRWDEAFADWTAIVEKDPRSDHSDLDRQFARAQRMVRTARQLNPPLTPAKRREVIARFEALRETIRTNRERQPEPWTPGALGLPLLLVLLGLALASRPDITDDGNA